MSDNDIKSVVIIISMISIMISLFTISNILSGKECDNCPNYWDIQQNTTISYIDHDVIDKKECIEKYPMGYYHTMINGNCKVTFWKSDLD